VYGFGSNGAQVPDPSVSGQHVLSSAWRVVQIGLPPDSLAAKISISAQVCPSDAGGIASGSDTPPSQKTHGSSMTPDGQHVASSA